MITLKQLKDKLHKDFGWENLESDDNKWFVDNLLKDTIQAIEVIRCSTQLPDVYLQELSKVESINQTQIDLNSQMQILRKFANKLGLYDVSDYLKK